VSMELYNGVVKCRLEEVFEVRSSLSTINHSLVKDIAFVFHFNVLEYDLPNCAGMSRVFYTRFHYDRSNRLQEVDCRHHSPFSTVVLDSYPSRIWFSIMEVKEKIEKLLNDPKQYQMCKKMVPLNLSLESWSYLSTNLVNSGPVVARYVRSNTKKYMHCDLGLSSHRIKDILTLVRIDCLIGLEGARKIFGSTFGIGVRNRAPNKGKSRVTLHHSDIVNFVDVQSNVHYKEYERRKEYVAGQGIDFIYNPASRVLKIQLRYCKVDAHKPIVTDTLKLREMLRNGSAVQQDLEVNSWVSHITPGTYFATPEGQLASVIHVEGNNVYVMLDYDANEAVFDLIEAARLLKN
jgi:hypothetical protein